MRLKKLLSDLVAFAILKNKNRETAKNPITHNYLYKVLKQT